MRLLLPIFVLGCAGADGPFDARTEGPPGEIPAELRDKAGRLDCAPRSDTGYDRGRSFPITVIEIDGRPVEQDTAHAYYRMQRQAAADGVAIQIVSGFRTHAEQRYLYNCYRTCGCNNCNLAAAPGYSNHQSGHALDLNTGDPGVLWWLNRNANRFGFVRTVPSEDWHWEYWGGAGPGPCDNPAEAIEVYWSRGPDGTYALRAIAPSRVARVRYEVDGHVVATDVPRDDPATTEIERNFPASTAFSTERQSRTLVVLGEDAEGLPIARGIGLIETVPGTAVYVRQMGEGLYEIGLERAPDEVETLRVEADGWPLLDVVSGSERSPRLAVRSLFNLLGPRTFVLSGHDSNGTPIVRSERSFTLE